MGRFVILPLLGLFVLGSAETCPSEKTSPGRELLCYTSTHDMNVLADTICKCTTLVHEGHDLLELTASDLENINKDLKKMNPAIQFVVSINDARGSLKTSGLARHEGIARIASILNEVDGIELNVTAGSKERLVHFVQGLREEMVRKSKERRILLALPTTSESLAKQFDIKGLSKYVDLFTIPSHFLMDNEENHRTFHPSRLMGLFDMLNTDSLVDLVHGLGAEKKKILVSLPASGYKFSLKNKDENAPRALTEEEKPVKINRKELCQEIEEGEWTVERDEDLTAPYAFKDRTWIAFEDKISAGIKGKYVILRDLAGIAIRDIDEDITTDCSKTITEEVYHSFTNNKRKTRQAILTSLQGDIYNSQELVNYPDSVKSSNFRISRVVDNEGKIRAIRENTQTEFSCPHQGYFVHPKSCNRFYRCVKFNQEIEEYSVFEFDCPPGLSFDERIDVCNWPGSLPQGSACPGSPEIAPSTPHRFHCPSAGFHADQENCRTFFACMDLGEEEMMAYEFQCPYGLVFDEGRLACEWPWLVPRCAGSGYEQNYGGGQGAHGGAHGGYDETPQAGHGWYDESSQGSHGGYDESSYGDHGGYDGSSQNGNGWYDGSAQGGHGWYDGSSQNGNGWFDGSSQGDHRGGNPGGPGWYDGTSQGGHQGGNHGGHDGGHDDGRKGGHNDGKDSGHKGGHDGEYDDGHKGGHDDGKKGGHKGGHDGGYDDGHKGGHDDGYDDGHKGGHDDGYDDGHKGGHDDGKNGGHKGGHDGGYDDGHKGGHDDGYDDGHKGGHDDGKNGGHKGGHDGGYDDGHKGGHDDGYDDGHKGGHDDGKNGGHKGGHDGGYDDGHKGGHDDGYDDGHKGGHDDGKNGGHKGGHDGGYDDGHKGGHDDGYDDGHKGGHDDGKNGGHKGGHDGGYDDGHKGGHDDGYDDGHKGGHDDGGYDDGHKGAHDDGYDDGHKGGHDDGGYDDGHKGAHDDGYDDGHKGEHDDGYDDGHKGGHDDGNDDGHKGGHDDGKNGGHKGGHDGGYDDGHKGGHDDGYDDGHKGGHDDGYDDGHKGGHDDEYEDGHKGEHDDGYDDGHKGGHDDGKNGGHKGGHDDGKNGGHKSGHDDEYEDGHKGGHDDGHKGGHDDGYEDGHKGGHDDGYEYDHKGHGKDSDHKGGHDGGKDEGHKGGHDDGYEDGHKGGHDDEYENGHKGHGKDSDHKGRHDGGKDDGHNGGHDDEYEDRHEGGHEAGNYDGHSDDEDGGHKGGHDEINHDNHNSDHHGSHDDGYGDSSQSESDEGIEGGYDGSSQGGHVNEHHGGSLDGGNHGGHVDSSQSESDEGIEGGYDGSSHGVHESGKGIDVESSHGGYEREKDISEEGLSEEIFPKNQHSSYISPVARPKYTTESKAHSTSTPQTTGWNEKTTSKIQHNNYIPPVVRLKYTTESNIQSTWSTPQSPEQTGSHGYLMGNTGSRGTGVRPVFVTGNGNQYYTNQAGQTDYAKSGQSSRQRFQPGTSVISAGNNYYSNQAGAGSDGSVTPKEQVGQGGFDRVVSTTYSGNPFLTNQAVTTSTKEMATTYSGNPFLTNQAGIPTAKDNIQSYPTSTIVSGNQFHTNQAGNSNEFRIKSTVTGPGYKTNEYHDNGGRGTIRYNNGLVTHKYTEDDVKNNPNGLPVVIHSGFTREYPGNEAETFVPPSEGVYTKEGFTKTGPTKTGITTAQVGGSGTYVAGSFGIKPFPPSFSTSVNSPYIGDNAFGTGSKNRPNPDIISGTSGYQYTKPTIEFNTGATSMERKEQYPKSNIKAYNSPVYVPNGPVTQAPTVVNTYPYTEPMVTASGDRYPRPFSAQKYPTVQPIGYTTGAYENYQTTVFEAAKLPVAISTVRPVIDDGYKTVVSSTTIPVVIQTSANYDHVATNSHSNGEDFSYVAVPVEPVVESFTGARRPPVNYQPSKYDTTDPVAVEDKGYSYEKSNDGSFGERIKSTTSTSAGKNNQPGTTFKPQVYRRPSTTISSITSYEKPVDAIKPDVFREPFPTISPTAGVIYLEPFRVDDTNELPTLPPSSPKIEPTGYKYPKPSVQFITTPAPLISYATDGPREIPARPTIDRSKVDRLVTNYDRDSQKFGSFGGNNNGDESQHQGPSNKLTAGTNSEGYSRRVSTPSSENQRIRYTTQQPAITTYSGSLEKSTIPSNQVYRVETKEIGQPKSQGKVIVKYSDLHPILLGKLGGECTCKADPFAVFRSNKPLIIDSSKGKIDLRNYDESNVYVELGTSRETGQYNGESTESSRIPTRSSKIQSTSRPSTTYLPSTTSSTLRVSASDIEASASFGTGRIGIRAGKSLGGGSSRTGNSFYGGARDSISSEDIGVLEVSAEGRAECARAGLFRHPKFCNKFYACHWDEWKKKFILHVFNCPVHLTFDRQAGACNWPSKGPACQDNKLLL